MFHVGQKVVCVNAVPKRSSGGIGLHGLTEGAVYTIRSIKTFPLDQRLNLWVEEITRPYGSVCGISFAELPYDSIRFRPAVEPKSETSFTEGAPKDSERWDNRKIKVNS
jgi:hypothetical protein